MASEPQQLPTVHEAWLPREHALHRPRHGGRQLTALICALVFFVSPTLLWVFGVRPAEIENHPLAGLPGLTKGWGLFTDLPTWATDQLSFRSGAITAADGISRALFGEPAPLDQGTTPNGGPLPGSPQQGPGKPGPVQSQPGYRRVVEGAEGWLYYGYDADAKCSRSRPLRETLTRLNALRQAVEDSGRKFVLVVPPDKSTMVPQYLPASYPGKECRDSALDGDWAQITGTGRALDLRPQLRVAEAGAGHPVYPRNDTHWADEGALTMARGLAEAVSPGVTSTWTVTPAGQYTVGADLPSMLGKRDYKTNTSYELRPDGMTNRTDVATKSILQPAFRVSDPIPGTVDRRTLVYGDSFTEVSSPYLGAAFSNLTMLAYPNEMTDLETSANAFAEADIVVVEAVERNVSAGVLSFLGDEFIQAVRTKLAQRPIR